MDKKIKLINIIISLACLLLVSLPVRAVDVIPMDEQVKIVLSQPSLNEDNTVCDDLAGYYIYRSTTSGGPYTRLNNVLLPPSTGVYIDRHLVNNVDYYYIGTSVDDVGNESKKTVEEKLGRPTGDEEKPSSIVDLTAVCQSGTVALDWSYASDNVGIDHYTIYRELTEIKDIYLAHKNTPAQLNEYATVDAQTNTFTDSSVNAGTTYFYVVTAFDASENEADSSNSVSILACGTDITPPLITSLDEDSGGIPQKGGNLLTLILVGESRCQATVTIGDISGELVMEETAMPGTYILTYTIPGDVNQSGIAISSKLKDNANNVTEKIGDATIDIDNNPPLAVSGLTLTALEAAKVKLNWQVGDSGDTHHYIIYRHSQVVTLDNKINATILTNDLAVDQLEYIDETAKAGQTFYYAVSAVDKAGNEALTVTDPISIAEDTLPPEIVLVSEDTMGATRKAGDVIAITIIGEPGLTASFTIENLTSEISMTEELLGLIATGTYNGSYTIKPGDNIMDAKIVGTLVDDAGLVTTKEAAGLINIVTDSNDHSPPVISSIMHDAVDVLVTGDILEVTLEGETGGVAYADLGTIEKAIILNEITDGIYTGTYTVAQGDNLKNGYILGHLVDSAGNEAVEQAVLPIEINTNLVIEMNTINGIIAANGSSSVEIKAKVKNARGENTANKMVDFTLVGGDGSLTGITSTRTNSQGEARTTYQTGEIVSTAFIAAEAVNTGDVGITYVLTKKTISVDIALIDAHPRYKTTNESGYSIELFAKPHRITANGHSISVITALVTLNGEPVENVRVSFDVIRGIHGNEGFLRVQRGYTDANGEAEAIYTSGTKTQLILIQATAFVGAGAPVSENTQVLLIAGGVKFLTIEAEPNELIADGSSTSIVTVKTEDEFNNLVPGIKVEFSIENHLGSLEDSYNFTSEPTYPVMGDEQPAVGGGEASIVFTAGMSAGIETVTATVTSQTWGGAGNFFQEGLDNFAQGNYEGTIEKFELALQTGVESNLGFTTDYTEENWTDDVLYMRGYSYEMTGDYLSAINSFEEVVSYYFGGEWADNAQYRIALSYEKNGNLSSAIKSYQDVIDKFRTVSFDRRDLKDNAQFRLGRTYEKSGYVVLARNAYQRLLDYYPGSPLADDAQAAVDRLSGN